MAAAGDRPRPGTGVSGQHGLDDLVEIDEVESTRSTIESRSSTLQAAFETLDLRDDQIQVTAHVGRGAPEASGGLGERQHRGDGLSDLVQRRAQALDVPEHQLLEASALSHQFIRHRPPCSRALPPRRALSPHFPRRRA